MKKNKVVLLVIGGIFSFIITLSLLLNSYDNLKYKDAITANKIELVNFDKYLPKFLNRNSEFNIVIEKNIVSKKKLLPIFKSTAIPDDVFKIIDGISFKSNKLISRNELRYLEVSYWSFNNKEYIGELICHKSVANDLLEIFEELYNEKYLIDKIILVDIYDGDDLLSMNDNNTHAFNYRNIAGTRVLSNHSYGLAIDINPIQNPYINGDTILPDKASKYKNRNNIRQGMIIKDDFLYKAFIKRGWIWGGNWENVKDYQHFEKKINNIND